MDRLAQPCLRLIAGLAPDGVCDETSPERPQRNQSGLLRARDARLRRRGFTRPVRDPISRGRAMIRQRTERIAALAMTLAVTVAALTLPANPGRYPAAPLVAHA